MQFPFTISFAIELRSTRLQTASDLVRESNGLDPLVAIVKEKNYRENKPLISAATGKLLIFEQYKRCA